ncbi:MAG TPA: SPOR domain-containing protein [Gammaproteobacteria bacterium]
MELGLKERLIGAAVLVVLGVIIIPFFLKGSPAPDSSVNQALTLPPSGSTAVQQYTLPLDASTAPGAALAAAPATAAAPTAATAPVLQPAPKAKAPVHSIARTPAPKPAPVATQANGKWMVQAGSYGTQANADKVVKTLKAHGIKASVSRFAKAGHTYYRVRTGPYAERSDADKAAGVVSKAIGGKASVVPND